MTKGLRMYSIRNEDSLKQAIRRFDPTLPLARSQTPPSSWYTDPRFLTVEREAVFRRSWQFVGRADQVRRPGDYFCGDLLGLPFVVTRDEKGGLRAFYNVCSHHGSRLVDGQGRCREMVCPYHGWTYSLSGRLTKAPKAGAIEALTGRGLDLKPLPVHEWGPFILVHFGEGALPFERDINGFDALFPDTLFNGLEFILQKRFEVDANWKVFIDNFLDGGYHVAHMHPTLAGGLDLKTYRSELGARWSLQTCRSSPGNGRVGDRAHYAWIYPNFMLNRYGKWLDCNWVLPLSSDRCLVIFDYFYEGVCPPEEKESAMAASLQVQLEDREICKRVWSGLHSGVYDQGVYSAHFEAPMHQFHRLLFQDYCSWSERGES